MTFYIIKKALIVYAISAFLFKESEQRMSDNDFKEVKDIDISHNESGEDINNKKEDLCPLIINHIF